MLCDQQLCIHVYDYTCTSILLHGTYVTMYLYRYIAIYVHTHINQVPYFLNMLWSNAISDSHTVGTCEKTYIATPNYYTFNFTYYSF